MSGFSDARVSKAERQAAAIRGTATRTVGPVRRPLDIVEFILGSTWLARRSIYPRQLTLAKILTLADHLFTDNDHKVIAEWSSGFSRDEEAGGSWTGTAGTTPDVYRRIEMSREAGRLWFRHPVLVIGRRGGKGHLGALVMAYILWWYITLDDPHDHFGIAPEKVLALFVFAANRLQALDNQAQDLFDIIGSAPCFQPYIAEVRRGRVRLWSHKQLQEGETDPRKAHFEISAREATPRAGRGPAAMAIAFDEVAWMQATGANRSAAEVENAALPALDQCRPYEFIYSASTPWSQVGRFYENHRRALEVDPATGEPVHYDMVTFQLASWDPYQDFERTGPGGLEVAPGRGLFPKLDLAIQAYDDDLRREEEANPETFAVERRAQWAAAPTAYLQADRVREIFKPFERRALTMQDRGSLRGVYFGHADPSVTSKNFAVAIGHPEWPDPERQPHTVFDFLHVWRPQDFPDGRIDYLVIEEELGALMDAFRLRQLTVDQFGAGSLLDHLQDRASTLTASPRTQVFEINETQKSNWRRAEEFKRLVNEGRVHAPHHELAELELIFLQQDGHKVRAPTMGPVQTDDLADAMMTVATQIDAMERSPHRQLDQLKMHLGYRSLPPTHEYAQKLSVTGPRQQMVGTARQTERRRRQR